MPAIKTVEDKCHCYIDSLPLIKVAPFIICEYGGLLKGGQAQLIGFIRDFLFLRRLLLYLQIIIHYGYFPAELKY